MKAIIDYIENLFMTIPNSSEKERMKAELIQANLDKYDDLMAKGKTHEEALGILIEDFGDIADIQAELGKEDWGKATYRDEDRAMISAYRRFRSRSALGRTIGVVLCIFAAMLVDMWEETEAASIAFYVLVAIAVGCFVYFGIKDRQFTDSFQKRGIMEFNNEKERKGEIMMQTNESKVIYKKAVHYCLWLIIVSIYLALGFIWEAWHPGWIVFLVGAGISIILETWL